MVKETSFAIIIIPVIFLGEEADRYVAAAGHYGNKSHCLVKDYATDLGYEYLSGKQ